MNKIFKNLIVFMGTVFAIFMGCFGVSGVYTSQMGGHNYEDDPIYFFMLGFFCLAITATAIFISVKLYYHR